MSAQMALGIVAISAFDSAWLLRDGASASANPATQKTETIVEAAGSDLTKPLDQSATLIPVNAVINTEPTPRPELAAGVASPPAETLAAAIATLPTSAEAERADTAVRVAQTVDCGSPQEETTKSATE